MSIRGDELTKRDPDTVRRKVKTRLADAKLGTTRIVPTRWGGGEETKERG